MHTFIQRANSLLTYAGTVLVVLCLATTITGDLWRQAKALVDVTMQSRIHVRVSSLKTRACRLIRSQITSIPLIPTST